MKPVSRRLRRHFGATARKVAVRSERPWYWQWLTVIALLLLGYLAAYWQFTGGKRVNLQEMVTRLSKENQFYQSKLIYNERQLQVEQATQANLNKVLSAVQDENIKLKEELAFYKNMLNEKTKK